MGFGGDGIAFGEQWERPTRVAVRSLFATFWSFAGQGMRSQVGEPPVQENKTNSFIPMVSFGT